MGASGQVSACLELLLYTSAFPSGHHGLYQEFLEWSVITLSKSTVTKAEAQLALGSPHTSPAWGILVSLKITSPLGQSPLLTRAPLCTMDEERWWPSSLSRPCCPRSPASRGVWHPHRSPFFSRGATMSCQTMRRIWKRSRRAKAAITPPPRRRRRN